MFTLDQIKAAHSKVKSGADFPNYIQDLIKLGITSYQTFVNDGHTDFKGANNYAVSSPPKYDILVVADKSNAPQFISDLKIHQQGKTDYPTFCKDCAKSGIEKWEVNMENMTCIYYDKTGNTILHENIPSNVA